VAEAEEVAKFVSQDGFKVVSFRERRKSLRRGKYGVWISWTEVDIRVENLANFRGRAPLPS